MMGSLDRQKKMRSQGFIEEAEALIFAARANGVCAICHRKFKSRLPLGDTRRRFVCAGSCATKFYEEYYRSMTIAKQVVLKRVRAKNGGEIRCELCGKAPMPYTVHVHVNAQFEYDDHRTGYEFDHIVEVAAGGDPQDPSNLQLLCVRCHRRKTTRFMRRGLPSGTPVNQMRLDGLDSFGFARGARSPSSEFP